MEKIIKQVWVNKSTNQKMITVPKDCDIEAGDYVILKKVE